MSLRKIALASLTLLLAAAGNAAAQSDIIRGRVIGPDSLPVENANVVATAFGGDMSRSIRTGKDGRYTIVFSPASGNYLVSVQAIGFQQAGPFQVMRETDEPVLVRDFRLGRNPVMLNAIVTNADRQRPQMNDEERRNGGVGSDNRTIDANGLPVGGADLASMAASLPGVQYIPGVDGGAAGFSILGLDASQNLTTLNGMSFDGAELPMGSTGSAGLSSNPFNPAQGGFSGGQLNVTTRGGTNYIQQSLNVTTDPSFAQFTDLAGRQLGTRSDRITLNASRSGAITFDKTYYAISGMFRQQTNDLQTLLNTDAIGLQRVGVSPDSVARLLTLIDRDGIPVYLSGIPDGRKTQSGSSVLQFNFNPSGNKNYSITGTGTFSRQLAAGLGNTTVPVHGGESLNLGGSLQGRSSFYFGSGFLNETMLGGNMSKSSSDAYLSLPDARVRITSEFEDGTSGVTNLTFGGNSGYPTENTTYTVNSTNTTNWFTMDNKHRFQLGAELRYNRYTQDQNRNQLGTYTYNSLADYEAGIPSSFSRLLQPTIRTGDNIASSVSFGDTYSARPNLRFTYGARADISRFNKTPRFNEKVEQLFGVRNDEVPTGIYISPRFGFSYTRGTGPQIAAFQGAQRASRQQITGGIGVFQNVPGSQLVSNALETTGLPGSTGQISCIGGAVPLPDWDAFLDNTNTIPSTCADGSAGTVFSSPTPNVALFDNGYTPQRSWRGSLGYNTPILNNRFNLRVNGTYSLNLNQQGTVDLNFDPTVRFNLAGEGNRPVFVAPTSIVTTTGSISSRASRKTQDFSRVTSYVSDLESVSRQIQLSLSPARFSTGFRWSANYTWQGVRDLTRGFNGNTAGNPFDTQWSRSSGSPRHQISTNLNYTFRNAISFSMRPTLQSGTPYTPMVGGDVNGDGSSNDRAFIFDPSRIADPALKASMQKLIDESPSQAKKCLTSQFGGVAGRNSCESPWFFNTSMNINLVSQALRLPQRATVSFTLNNPLTGVDALVNGWDDLKGWGTRSNIDPTLLYVRGFDPMTNSYKYEVNQRFGKTSTQQSNRVSTFAITMNVRFDIGPERERQMLGLSLRQGRGRDGNKMNEQQWRQRYRGSVQNPFELLLRQTDTLKLTVDQADSIATLNVKFSRMIDSTWTPVARYLAAIPDKLTETHEDEAWDMVKKAQNDVINRLAVYGPSIKSLLTKDQLNLMPAFLMVYLDEASIRALRPGASNARERLGGFGGGGR